VQRLAPFGLGAALAPAAALGVYASLGGLDGLARDLFVYPLRMKNYYMASRTPPVDAALLVAGAVFATSAVLSALRGRWRGALAMALPGLAGVGLGLSLHAVAGPSAAASGSAWLHTRNFDEVFGPLAVLAGTCALAPLLLAGTDGVAQRRALPVLFLGATFVFQAFPRGFLSSWIVEAACLPALTWALFRWRRLGLGERVGMFRRGVATLLVLLIPIWMASHALAPNGPIRRFGASRRALDLPGVAGVELDAGSIRFGAWPQIEALIAHIRRVEPADAPVLLFGQAWMIVFLSGRPMLYPKRSLPLILLSIDMLRDAEIAELDEAAMLEQLRNAPDAIVIDEQGPESKRMRTGLPRLSAFLDREYTRRTQFGRYAVLRREPSAGFQAERR